MNEKRERYLQILAVVIIIIVYILYGRYSFNEDGPREYEKWRVGASNRGILLKEIGVDPLVAVFEYDGQDYEVVEFEWYSIGEFTFKIRIYEDDGYVWAIWR